MDKGDKIEKHCIPHAPDEGGMGGYGQYKVIRIILLRLRARSVAGGVAVP